MAIAISRRALLLSSLFSASGVAYARFVEPGWLEMTERTCRLPNLTRPIKLLHLSDFHASRDVPQSLIENAIQMAIHAKPDLICVTGDFVTNGMGFDAAWYTSALRRLSAKAPTFAVLGNHDGGVWAGNAGGSPDTTQVRKLVADAGIKLLHNRSCTMEVNRARLQLVGVGDMWAEEVDADVAFRNADTKLPTVLLSHNPDSKDFVAAHPWHLMLSGHTHGGQVVMPVLGLSPAPVSDRRYVAGLKPWEDRWIHVSCGVGNIDGVRFNCRPEVTTLHLI